MKSHAVWLDDVRLSKRRKDILKLLGGDEAALQEIERAASAYLALTTATDRASETKAQVRDDLKGLVRSLAVLSDFFRKENHGSAHALFMGEATEKGVLRQSMQLDAALAGLGGDLLVQSARSALDKWPVTAGRNDSPDLNGRVDLVGRIATIAKRLGIVPKRDGVFVDLVQAVYESVGIATSKNEIIKADGDIRKAGF